MKLSFFILFNLNTFIFATFIPNINKISMKEMKNYQKILEIQEIPCFMQTIRIKTYPSAIDKQIKYNYTTINQVNDLIGFRFIFYNRYDLLKFYYHLYNEKKIVSNYFKISDNHIIHEGIVLRYQNEYTECPIYQMECQMFIIYDYYNFLMNESPRKIERKNLIFPYTKV